MKIFQKSIATLLVICLVYSLLPTYMLPSVSADTQGESGSISGEGITHISGGITGGDTESPVFRISLSRDKRNYMDGTEEARKKVIQNYTTLYPEVKNVLNSSLYFWPSHTYTAASNYSYGFGIGQKQNDSLVWNKSPQYAKLNIQMKASVSNSNLNPFKDKVMQDINSKKISSVLDLTNKAWKAYLPSYDVALNSISFLFQKTGDSFDLNGRLKLIVDENFVNTPPANLNVLQKEKITAGYAGLLVNLYVIALKDPNTAALAGNYEACIEDYLSNQNDIDKPVSLVIDMCMPVVIDKDPVYPSVCMPMPVIDYIEYSVLSNSNFSVKGEKGEAFLKSVGNSGYTTKEMILKMAERSSKDIPFSTTYATKGYGKVRLADAGTSYAKYIRSNTALGRILYVPQYGNKAMRIANTGNIGWAEGTDKVYTGYLNVLKFDTNTGLDGFFIASQYIANPKPEVSYFVDDTTNTTETRCEMEVHLSQPPKITCYIQGSSSLVSSLAGRKNDNGFEGLTIKAAVTRDTYIGAERTETAKKMTELESELSNIFKGEDLIKILKGEKIVLYDNSAMADAFMRSPEGSQSIKYIYNISMEILIDKEVYKYKKEDIVLKYSNGAYKDFAGITLSTYTNDITLPEDIVIKKPSSTMTTDIVNPSEDENLKDMTQMITRYEYSSKGEEFAEIKNNEPLKENYEVMGGVPSSEDLYFSVGGSEFKVAMILQYWMNQHSRDRTYTIHFNGTSCEYNNEEDGKGDRLKEWFPKAQPDAAIGSGHYNDVSIHCLNPTGGGGGDWQIQATWTYYSTNHIPQFHACGICGSRVEDSCDFSGATEEYNKDLEAANKLAQELGAEVIVWTAASDGKTRERKWDAVVDSGSAPSDGTSAGDDGSDCDGGHSCTGHEVSCGEDCTTTITNPTSPCNPGSLCPGHGWTIKVTATIPAHAVCGPCCGHMLPELYDTWKQGLVYDFAKISQIRLYKLDQGYVEGTEELTGVDTIFASVVSGNPTYFMNIAQLTEGNSPILPNKAPPNDTFGLTKSVLEQKANTFFTGTNVWQVAQSSRDGRLRYILDPNYQKSDTISYSEQGNGSSGSFTINYESVANPSQHDDVIYEAGTRTRNCDGMATTGNFGKSSSNNVKPWDTQGHTNKWADGCLYTNYMNTSNYSNYWSTQTHGYSPKQLKENDVNANSYNNNKAYYEDYNHHVQRNGLTDKGGYSDKADQKDIATPEWNFFNKARRTKIVVNVISDFLILQTSGGDQSIFYYEKASPATEAQEHFQKVKITEEEMFTNNPLSLFNKKSTCGQEEIKEKDLEEMIVVGGYNGQYNKVADKYKPYSLVKKTFLPFAGTGGTYDANKKTGTYDAYGGTQIKTILDSDPAKTIARPKRLATSQETSFKILQKGIRIIPTTTNKLYTFGESRVWYPQVLGYYSIDADVANASDGTRFVNTISNVKIGHPQFDIAGTDYQTRWGTLLGIDDNAVYFKVGDDSTTGHINDVIVYTPVSTEDALVLKQDDLEINGQEISRDQRANAFDYPNMNDMVNALKVCPLDPELCEYRYLDCKYLHDTVLADFDFSEKYNTTEQTLVDGKIVNQEVTKNNTYLDGGKWVTTNKITGLEYTLPSGFTVETGSMVGDGRYLRANGTRWSIPFGDLGLSNTKTNRVSVEMDLTVNSVSNNMMLVSLYNYGFVITPNSAIGSFITRSPLNTSNIGARADASKSSSLRNVHLNLVFGFNSVIDCTATVDGVPATVTFSELRNVWETGPDGLRRLQLKQQSLNNVTKDPPTVLTRTDIGSNLNIGSWGSDAGYTANFYIDNLKVILKGGTTEHNSSCYKTVTVHSTKKVHTHTADCYLKEDIYTCDGAFNANYQHSDSSPTNWYNCNGVINAGATPDRYVFNHNSSGCTYYGEIHNSTDRYSCSVCGHSCGGVTGSVIPGNPNYYHVHSGTQGSTPNGCYTIPTHKHSGTAGTDSPNGCYTKPTVHKHNASIKTLTCKIPEGGTGTVYNYGYTGNVQSVTLPAGRYKLETWGAQGGTGWQNPGKYGHYAYGELTLTNSTTLYLYVGGAGGNRSGGGYNGGGTGYDGGGEASGGGGGSTDIRMNGSALGNRIIVAGGGGGGGHSIYNNGIGGSGVLGQGGAGGSHDRGGGGGGYYGGAAGQSQDTDGQDGSSYVGGVVSGSYSTGNNSGSGRARITNLDHKHVDSCYTTSGGTCPKIAAGTLVCTGELNTDTDFNTHVHNASCLTNETNVSSQTFQAIGDVQTYIVPYTDYYTFESYGSSVNMKAGYTKGTVKLTKGTIVYIYVGNKAGYNSGVTDVRLLRAVTPDGLDENTSNIQASLNSRMFIAGSTAATSSIMNSFTRPITSQTITTKSSDGNGRVIVTPSNTKTNILNDIVNGTIKPDDAKKYLGDELFNQIMGSSEKVLHTWSGWSTANDKGFKAVSQCSLTMNGNLVVSSTGDDPIFNVPLDNIPVNAVTKIKVYLNNCPSIRGQLFLVDGTGYENEADSVWSNNITVNANNQVMTFDIAANKNFSGNFTKLRFDTSAQVGTYTITKIEVIGYGSKTNGSGEASYINNEKIIATAGTVWTYNYTGGVQTKTLEKGKYKLEVWGAQGGADVFVGGLGGKAEGSLILASQTVLYIYVGSAGGSWSNAYGGYNGGGIGGTTPSQNFGGGGGGATDIRMNGSALGNRIIVAGGGGGADGNGGTGGYGGGLEGQSLGSAGGGTQSTGGRAGYTECTAGTFGQGGSGGSMAGGGGGGWYGGGGGDTMYGAGGGSGYIGGVTGGSMQNGVQSGNGLAKITALEDIKTGEITYSFTPLKISYVSPFNGQKQTIIDNFEKIPDYLADGSINPIWLCRFQELNSHVCQQLDVNGNVVNLCRSYTILNCSEPHHRGEHYSSSNRICWSACKNDDNHKNTKTEVIIDKDKNEVAHLANFLQLDSAFTVYFPNRGNFYGNGASGLAVTQGTRGKGYTDNMDTTNWTREKRVRFSYDVIFEDELRLANQWIDLDVPTEYFNFYLPVNNSEASNAQVEFEVEAINCATGTGLDVIGGLNYNSLVSTDYAKKLENFRKVYLDKLFSAVMGGYKVPQVTNKATSELPFGSLGYLSFFEDKARTTEEDLRKSMDSINKQLEKDFEGGSSTNNKIEPHTKSTTGINYKAKPITSNDNYVRVDNKVRSDSLESLHGGYKCFYLDILGRIGNFALVDTEDFRFSNFFKEPIVSWGDTEALKDASNWLVEGVVLKIDDSIQNFYVGDLFDIRGNKASPDTHWLNTYGTQTWMEGQLSGEGRDLTKPNLVSQILTNDINNIDVLKLEPLRYGYDAYTSISTMGNYESGHVQVIPKYYALKLTDKVNDKLPDSIKNLPKGSYIPLDIYIDKDGEYQPVNIFGNASNGNANITNAALYDYPFNLDWTSEVNRRNYTLEEQARTKATAEFLKSVFYNYSDDLGEHDTSDLEIIKVTDYPVPKGKNNYLGTAQYILMDGKHRTFMGSSDSYGNNVYTSQAGTTDFGINKNKGNVLDELYFNRAVQRWHGKLGVPSSAVFVPHGEIVDATTITYVMNDDYAIICTAETIAIGNVWSLYYSQPWFKHLSIDGETYSTSTHYPGHRVTDGNGKSVECPVCLPPIIAVYSGKNSSIDDLEIINTH